MVGIAQLVSAPDCGSGGQGFESLYPPCLIIIGLSPSGKAQDFDSCITLVRIQLVQLILLEYLNRVLSFGYHIYYGPLAQVVEHLTFNQVVRGSSPRWLTKKSVKSRVSKVLRFSYILLNYNHIKIKLST